ncbi:unnamed protein product [Amoebophrya sp. A25]|nr:unnamed protein product [Amoebophrya sp. A25]|eukprot:GSA25T00004592001.1
MKKLSSIRSWLRGGASSARLNKGQSLNSTDDAAYFNLVRSRLTANLEFASARAETLWLQLKKAVIAEILAVEERTREGHVSTTSSSGSTAHLLAAFSGSVDARDVKKSAQIFSEVKKLGEVFDIKALQDADDRLTVWQRLDSALKMHEAATEHGLGESFDAWAQLAPWIAFGEEKLGIVGTAKKKTELSTSAGATMLKKRLDAVLTMGENDRQRTSHKNYHDKGIKSTSGGQGLQVNASSQESVQHQRAPSSSGATSAANGASLSSSTTKNQAKNSATQNRNPLPNHTADNVGGGGAAAERARSAGGSTRYVDARPPSPSSARSANGGYNRHRGRGFSTSSQTSSGGGPRDRSTPRVVDEAGDEIPLTARSNRSNVYEQLSSEKASMDLDPLKKLDRDRIRRNAEGLNTPRSGTPQRGESNGRPSHRPSSASLRKRAAPPLPPLPTGEHADARRREQDLHEEQISYNQNFEGARPFSAKSIRIAEALSTSKAKVEVTDAAVAEDLSRLKKQKRPVSAGLFAFRQYTKSSPVESAVERELGPGQLYVDVAAPGPGSSTARHTAGGSSSSSSDARNSRDDMPARPPQAPQSSGSQRNFRGSHVSSSSTASKRGPGADVEDQRDLQQKEKSMFSSPPTKGEPLAAESTPWRISSSSAGNIKNSRRKSSPATSSPLEGVDLDLDEEEHEADSYCLGNYTGSSAKTSGVSAGGEGNTGAATATSRKNRGHKAAEYQIPKMDMSALKQRFFVNANIVREDSKQHHQPKAPDGGAASSSGDRSDAGGVDARSTNYYRNRRPESASTYRQDPRSSSAENEEYNNASESSATSHNRSSHGGPHPDPSTNPRAGSSSSDSFYTSPRACQTPREHPRDFAARIFASRGGDGPRVDRPRSARPSFRNSNREYASVPGNRSSTSSSQTQSQQQQEEPPQAPERGGRGMPPRDPSSRASTGADHGTSSKHDNVYYNEHVPRFAQQRPQSANLHNFRRASRDFVYQHRAEPDSARSSRYDFSNPPSSARRGSSQYSARSEDSPHYASFSTAQQKEERRRSNVSASTRQEDQHVRNEYDTSTSKGTSSCQGDYNNYNNYRPPSSGGHASQAASGGSENRSSSSSNRPASRGYEHDAARPPRPNNFGSSQPRRPASSYSARPPSGGPASFFQFPAWANSRQAADTKQREQEEREAKEREVLREQLKREKDKMRERERQRQADYEQAKRERENYFRQQQYRQNGGASYSNL